MCNYGVKPIGRVCVERDGAYIALDKAYAPALAGLSGFGHVQVIWWCSGCGEAAARMALQEVQPYRKGPAVLGTFATRSPARPNPIAISCAQVTYVDAENAVIGLAYIDAWDGTPVLDIKPYTPSLDRVESPAVPDWCAHWPGSVEASGEFDWEAEFTF